METTTDSTNAGDPTNAGVQSGSDVKTDVLDNLTDTSQPSGGDDTTPKPAPATDVTGQPADDTTKPDDDDSGTVSRIKQQLADNNRLLAALNIDPESDLAERYSSGLVSKEELLLRVNPQPQPQSVIEPQATVAPRQKLDNLKQRLSQSVKDGKGIQETDILEVLGVVSDITEETDQLRQQTDTEKHFNECRNATLAVIERDELHKALPENIKVIESQVFLSSTDNLLATESGGNPKSFTIKNYDFYATKNLKERISAYRNHWIGVGKQLQQQATTKGSQTQVNPISPTVGSAPVTPVETPTTLSNMEERARKYVEDLGTV